MEPNQNPPESPAARLSPYEFADYIESRLGKNGVFSLYALRRGVEEPVAHRNHGTDNFRRLYTALIQFNRPDAVKVVGYKSNQKQGSEPNFVEHFWLITEEKREQQLYGFSASAGTPVGQPQTPQNLDELRGNILRDMTQQAEIQRLASELERAQETNEQLAEKADAYRKRLIRYKSRLGEKFRMESLVSRNLSSSLGGLLMGVVSTVRPELGTKLNQALSGLEMALPAAVNTEAGTDQTTSEKPTGGPTEGFLDSTTEQAIAAIEALPEARRADAVRILHALAGHPQVMDELIEYLNAQGHDTKTAA